MQSFFEKMVRAGLVKSTLDLQKAYTLDLSTRRSGLGCTRGTDRCAARSKSAGEVPCGLVDNRLRWPLIRTPEPCPGRLTQPKVPRWRKNRAAPRAALNDDIGEELRLQMYRMQVEIRDAEQRAFDLFLQNLVKGTSHLSLGQEAVAAGFAAAMRPGDLVFCTYRGHAHTLARGVPVEKVLGELMQRDNRFDARQGRLDAPYLRRAWRDGLLRDHRRASADRLRRRAARAISRATATSSVCFFGDGTTNIGAFHEALNFAVVWKLPVVFVCENNLYMEYTPIGDVTAVEHPAADRASAYGLDRIVIDGNDADIVYRDRARRLRAARAGSGPSLIECMTYRHSGHSRADPAKYRPDGELDRWKQHDPIKLYRERLKQFGIAEQAIAQIEAETMRDDRCGDRGLQGCAAAVNEIVTTDVYADGGFAWRN